MAWEWALVGVALLGPMCGCAGCGGQPSQPAHRPEPVASVEQSHNGLACEVFVPRQRFTPADGIPVYVLLVNVGTARVIVDRRMSVGEHVNLDLIAPDGEIIAWPGVGITLARPRSDDFVAIPPDCVYGRVVVVPGDVMAIEHSAGRYRVVARFAQSEEGSDVDIRAWTGGLRSNEAEFEIVPYKVPGKK